MIVLFQHTNITKIALHYKKIRFFIFTQDYSKNLFALSKYFLFLQSHKGI